MEGLVLGHPEILRKFNIAIKQEELEKQCKIEKIISGNDLDGTATFEFVELAPEVFQTIRKINNVDDKLIKKIFSHENMPNLHTHVSNTKGGGFFINPN